MKRTRRTLLLGAAGLLLIAAIVCGSLMRRATGGAADPDTQEISVAEVSSTVSERITTLGDNLTETAIRNAITDQLPALGKRGFIRVRVISRNVSVLAGTDYGLENVGALVTGNSWSYRLSLSPVETPDLLQPLYVASTSVGTGGVWTELTIGSAGPAAAQARTSASFMVAMWACVCLAAVCLIMALLPPGSRIRRAGSSWTPVRRGLTLALVGVLVAVPVAWALMYQTRTAARAQFARGTDLVAAMSASTLSGAKSSAELSAIWLHAFHSMEYVDSSFRVLVDGKLRNSAGSDYGPGSYVKSGAAGEWRMLSPITEDTAPRSVYVTAATTGKMRVEMAVAGPEYWQVIRLRTTLLWAIPAALAILFALGYFVGRRAEPTVLSSEEILRHAVVRQTVLTVLIVCLALVPAAGWFIQAYESASLGRLDEMLQRDAAGFQGILGSLEPATVAADAVRFADMLEIARTGLVFSLKYTTAGAGTVHIEMNPQYSMLSVVIGGNRPHYLVVANRTDTSVPPGKNMFVRVMTFGGRLRDGTVYTALLGTTTRSVQQDMQALWKSALWAGPVAFLFIVLASLIAAILALRPVTDSMRRLEQFTGDASHELRTPLSSIRLNAQVALAQDQQPEEFRRHLTAVLSQADRSTRLAESLVLLARLDRQGEVPLESARLADVWTDLSTAFADQLAAKELALQTSPEELTVTANRDLLTVALDNLLENAIHYSPARGVITVSSQRADGRVTIAVADQGPGIPPEALPDIWDRFYRVDASRSRDSGGSGLGLAIVRKAVEAMHGRVAVTSELGKGSTFSVILPAA
jgi:signal transduction histidine kinase